MTELATAWLSGTLNEVKEEATCGFWIRNNCVYILYFALNEVYSYPKSYTFSSVHLGIFIVLYKFLLGELSRSNLFKESTR